MNRQSIKKMPSVLQLSRIALAVFVIFTALSTGFFLYSRHPSSPQSPVARVCIPKVEKNMTDTSPHPRIIILSGQICNATDPNAQCRRIGHLSFYNRREYVTHHQCRYQLRDNFTDTFEAVTSQGVTPAWVKISILLEELEREEYDWIFWIDPDALFTNMDIHLEQLVDDRYSLLITKDVNSLNAGVCMLKVDDWSRRYMREVHSKMSKGRSEQDWMITLLKDPTFESDKHVKYLPQCSFNSYWLVSEEYAKYRPGDFVIHWPGEKYSDPVVFMKWWQNHRASSR